MPKHGSKVMVLRAASICAGYTKAPVDQPVMVRVTSPQGENTLKVLPVKPGSVSTLLI